MLRDGFDPNTWYYLYEFQPGRGDKERKGATLNFVGTGWPPPRAISPPAAFTTPLWVHLQTGQGRFVLNRHREKTRRPRRPCSRHRTQEEIIQARS